MGVVIVEREGAVLGVNVGRPIVTSGDCDVLFPYYFWEDLLFVTLSPLSVIIIIVTTSCYNGNKYIGSKD